MMIKREILEAVESIRKFGKDPFIKQKVDKF